MPTLPTIRKERKRSSLLLVEDDPVDRMDVVRCLARGDEPYDILEVANSAEAELLIRSTRLDLVLLDVNLGSESGLVLLQDIKDIPVIIMTGQGSEEVAAEALRAGAYDYVIKDTARKYLATLGHRISSVLARNRAERERESLIRQLQEALSSVKTLSGLIPICCSCKKIRNDAGFWNHLEKYVSEHCDAQFSHGMCPDCFDVFDAEVDAFIEAREPNGH